MLYRWREDDINITSSDTSGVGPWNMSVSVTSNGEVYRELNQGHFKLLFIVDIATLGTFSGTSACIPVGAGHGEVSQMMSNSVLSHSENASHTFLLSDYIAPSVKRFGDGKNNSDFKVSYVIVFKGKRHVVFFDAMMSTQGCATPRTIGYLTVVV